jgi:hypothetical protein
LKNRVRWPRDDEAGEASEDLPVDTDISHLLDLKDPVDRYDRAVQCVGHTTPEDVDAKIQENRAEVVWKMWGVFTERGL